MFFHRAESYQYPLTIVPSTEERRTLYTLQHYLHAPGQLAGVGHIQQALEGRSCKAHRH